MNRLFDFLLMISGGNVFILWLMVVTFIIVALLIVGTVCLSTSAYGAQQLGL